MQFQFTEAPGWPVLAWVAHLTSGDDIVTVQHGSRVEVRPSWFCEAAWDGDFEAGDFDLTDIVIGSGARIRDGRLCLVPAGSTVDRLQWIERDDDVYVSNSLAALLVVAGERLDPTWPYYHRAMLSVVKGLEHYERTLPLDRDNGVVELCYFDNIGWDGSALTRQAKPGGNRGFADYAEVSGFLSRCLAGIVDNMRCASRRHQYSLLGTLSKGYDSTTITALGKAVGLDKVICFERGEPWDRGSDLAPTLDVEPVEVHVDGWREAPFGEVLFIAGNGFGEEVHYGVLAEMLRGRVLLTGYHGDKIWDIDNSYPTETIRRGDPSGGALTEFRLHAGFLNCPMPFFGVRSAADMLRVNRSEEMRPWDTGEGYSRPVCRRIVESAGVPREAFGQRKNSASRWFVSEPDQLSRESRDDLSAWAKTLGPAFKRRRRVAPIIGRTGERRLLMLAHIVRKVLYRTPGTFRLGLDNKPITGHILNLTVDKPTFPPPVFGASRYVFPWAVERTMRRYASQEPPGQCDLTDR